MLPNMTMADAGGDACEESKITYHDGAERTLWCSDREVPFPLGKLIVSRTDPEGLITHVNQSFVEMSGWEEEDLIGAPHYVLRHPDMPAAAFKDLWDTMARGEKWHGYVKNLRKDGAYYWVYATVIANIRGGEVVGYTSVRRKPSRTKVNGCIDLYATMLEDEQ